MGWLKVFCVRYVGFSVNILRHVVLNISVMCHTNTSMTTGEWSGTASEFRLSTVWHELENSEISHAYAHARPDNNTAPNFHRQRLCDVHVAVRGSTDTSDQLCQTLDFCFLFDFWIFLFFVCFFFFCYFDFFFFYFIPIANTIHM